MEAKTFEVLITTYSKSEEKHLIKALESTLNSVEFAKRFFGNGVHISIKLGIDGPIPNSKRKVIDRFVMERKINAIFFPENRGLGVTLSQLILFSEADFIIRMDDDDLMGVSRVYEAIKLHLGGAQLVSGDIEEFDETDFRRSYTRKAASSLSWWRLYIRNPLNHVATSFCRKSILNFGNYRDVPFFEDWDLWVRSKSLVYAKLSGSLVKVRLSKNMIERRSGLNKIKYDVNFGFMLLKDRNLGFLVYFIFLPLRLLIRLMPKGLYKIILLLVLRK